MDRLAGGIGISPAFAWEMAREMGRRRGSVGGDGWGAGEGQGALLFRSLECVAGPGV
jgi:hypothetical protein